MEPQTGFCEPTYQNQIGRNGKIRSNFPNRAVLQLPWKIMGHTYGRREITAARHSV